MESIERSQHRAPSRLTVQKSNTTMMIIAAVIAVIVVVGGGIAAWALNGGTSAGSVIDSGKYQALTLVDGEQYFGKLQSMNNDYFKLTDVWYVQADQTTGAASADKTAADKKLAKLGNELHGPEDMMVISKDQVLYFENLKPDGKVSKLITQGNAK